ncbi:16S rRNA (guanine(966)-N(2))-methyltransferase RsmD [Shewanella dokdonensis]|uniref:Ribosomal RNA small subunit methyltransferase D n=1 Tax=Shewanella dokdonensis TaxID=712036 RepID=A0ABX8DIR8_9GAMM|nr:16S rRNA (guanine(966)-N(2))-methyltransferase RsmD [Shewanella dokdonensis]MCL1075681.1 16S rRNA (guanine(966)-N(2))-methyltransferase RsmD [Shewanella dokdonensis]QVK24674.1 16S rRNA (guanine(966)-N(2))-methyltransferase RsmD [Shewanella dokdonensis]
MARNRPGSGQVRIIAGQWRSRKLPIQDLEGLRPTTDRVRETLFNWLSGYLTGASVLDCFAGSGALSLEALSRYAAFARIHELQRSAAEQLKANLTTLKCDNAEVLIGDTLQLLSRPADRRFDIVFIDPPFRKGLAAQTMALLQQGWLNDDALIYVEVEAELHDLQVPAQWQPIKEKQAGQVSYRLYRYQEQTS